VNTVDLINRFMPHADIRERHETLVRAPADVVFHVAQHFDVQSIPIIRALFWLRAQLLGAAKPPADLFAKGLLAETQALGWGVLAYRPGRELIMGAATQPWKADVRFTSIPRDRFTQFAGPDLVKIVWTLEAEPLGPALTRFRTEVRVLATDDAARKKFRRYWRMFGMGIVLIRWLLLPALRREAERRASVLPASLDETAMPTKRHFSAEEARVIGTRAGIDWDKIDLAQFRRGLEVELEHGAHDPQTNVTNDDLDLTAKIAWAHLKEIPDYYSRLDAMEAAVV